MIMSAVDSTFFTLNETGTAIWQAADGQTPLCEIVATKICTEFDVSLGEAQQDAEEFVKELSQHGILRISERPIADACPAPAQTS